MECEETRNLMVLVLYKEATEEESKRLKSHLLKCKECAAYYEELKTGFKAVQKLPDLSRVGEKAERVYRTLSVFRVLRRAASFAIFGGVAVVLMFFIFAAIPSDSQVSSVEHPLTVAVNGVPSLTDFDKIHSLLSYELYKVKSEKDTNGNVFAIRVKSIKQELSSFQSLFKEENIWQ